MTVTPSAFAWLRKLLAGIPQPHGLEAIPLHLGESRLGVPAIDFTPLADVSAWTRYPPLGGTPELRAAYTGWLRRRFTLTDDSEIAVEPTPGSKQAVAALIALSVADRRDPVVVMPNPYYPTYLAATEAAGARPVFYSHVGEIAALAESAAAVVVCNPGNPRGEVLSTQTLRDIADGATNALLVVDECYTDLAHGTLPSGILETRPRGRFVVLHSLSKRSAVPGLRSGFLAGDPSTVAAYAEHNRSCGVSMPLPVCAVAAALWADDAHMSALQSALARNCDMADGILRGVPGYQRAEAGFFLWLPVDDDEETARRLWREQALSVMPGRYLAAMDARGVNPGVGYVRVALVHEEKTMRDALIRIRDTMTRHEELIA